MEEKVNEVVEKEVKQSDSSKTNPVFVVSIVSLIISVFVLAIIFAPVAIISGAYVLGNKDKRGWWGVVGGGIVLLLWFINLIATLSRF